MQRWGPERTCRAGTAPLSRCGPWSFSHISGMLGQCLLSSEATISRAFGWWGLKVYLYFSVSPVHLLAVRRCLFSIRLQESPQIAFQCWIFFFFLVSQNVLCLSELLYSGLLMDSGRKCILQFCACLRIFFLRLIYQSLNPAPWLLSFTLLKSAFVRPLMQ